MWVCISLPTFQRKKCKLKSERNLDKKEIFEKKRHKLLNMSGVRCTSRNCEMKVPTHFLRFTNKRIKNSSTITTSSQELAHTHISLSNSNELKETETKNVCRRRVALPFCFFYPLGFLRALILEHEKSPVK